MNDLQKFRIEFARVSNVVLSHEMKDDDRRSYWLEVLEPVWGSLKISWHMEDGIPRDEWELVIRSALTDVRTPSQWRSARWRAGADRKAKRIVQDKEAARAKVEEKTGKKFKEAEVNTKAFWQGQSFGPASPVTRIDPSTYKLED